MVLCSAPGCVDEATYKEPNKHAENGYLRLCKRHVDPTVDGIETL